MRKFRFRFQAVEKVRKMREDEALRKLGEAQSNLQKEKDKKAALFHALNASLERRQSLGQQAIAILPFQLESEFIVGTKQRMVQADQAILRANRVVEKALRNYLHLRRQTRMIETIREKHLAQFKEELKKKEELELADLYVMRSRIPRLGEEA